MKSDCDDNWLFFLKPDLQQLMKGDLIQVKDPFCKRSKRALSDNNYQHGSQEINRLLIDKKTIPDIRSEMTKLGFQIQRT
jgi:hypothetical protein